MIHDLYETLRGQKSSHLVGVRSQKTMGPASFYEVVAMTIRAIPFSKTKGRGGITHVVVLL